MKIDDIFPDDFRTEFERLIAEKTPEVHKKWTIRLLSCKKLWEQTLDPMIGIWRKHNARAIKAEIEMFSVNAKILEVRIWIESCSMRPRRAVLEKLNKELNSVRANIRDRRGTDNDGRVQGLPKNGITGREGSDPSSHKHGLPYGRSVLQASF